MSKHQVKSEGSANVKLPPLPKAIAAMPVEIANLVAALQKSADWPNQPAVQTAVNKLQSDGVAAASSLAAVTLARAGLRTAIGARGLIVRVLKVDRRNALAALNVACGGSAAAVAAWNCNLAANVIAVPTTDAPTGLTLANAKVIGDVDIRWDAVRANKAVYLLQQADPATPGAWLPALTLTRAKVVLTGQVSGHVLTYRVAVVRTTTGTSVWSTPMTLTVR